MRFIIIGAGRVGFRTARVLSREGHDVTLIERDETKAERARTAGFEVVEGDGSKEEVLVQAGIERAEAMGALTSDMNANYAACMTAKHYGLRTILRIDEDYREDIYRKFADDVDEIIYPERLGAIGAKNALLGGNIRAIADIAQNLQVVELTVTEASPMQGYSISELQLPANARMLAFGKNGETMGIPFPDESLEVGDRIAVLADFEVLEDVRQLPVGEASPRVAGGD